VRAAQPTTAGKEYHHEHTTYNWLGLRTMTAHTIRQGRASTVRPTAAEYLVTQRQRSGHRPRGRAEPNPLLRSTFFAAVIALSSIIFGHPAIASAEPGEWDIGAYDDCMAGPPVEPNESAQTHMAYCCITSGGQPVSIETKCVAPAANAPAPNQAPPTKWPPRPGQATLIPSTQPDAP
jgi:hypothetical protein